MTPPTPAETAVFLAKLRDQASFLQDPAIIDAVAFIERLVAGIEVREATATLPETTTSKQSTSLKEAA